LPSPLAQKLILLFFDRFAGFIGVAPGENSAPANRNGPPATTSPVTCIAPFVFAAPGSTTSSFEVDFPPFHGVAGGNPHPIGSFGFSFIELLTMFVSEPAGTGAVAAGLPVSPLVPVTVSFTVLVLSELGPTISRRHRAQPRDAYRYSGWTACPA